MAGCSNLKSKKISLNFRHVSSILLFPLFFFFIWYLVTQDWLWGSYFFQRKTLLRFEFTMSDSYKQLQNHQPRWFRNLGVKSMEKDWPLLLTRNNFSLLADTFKFDVKQFIQPFMNHVKSAKGRNLRFIVHYKSHNHQGSLQKLLSGIWKLPLILTF